MKETTENVQTHGDRATPLNSQWVVEEIKGEIKKFPRIR
jgi:hypothetical protein